MTIETVLVAGLLDLTSDKIKFFCAYCVVLCVRRASSNFLFEHQFGL